MNKIIKYSLIIVLLILAHRGFTQLSVVNSPQSTNGSPSWLIENILLGNGVTATNISFQGDSTIQIGFFDQNNSNIGLSSGIIMTTGNINLAPGSPGNFQPNAGFDLASGSSDGDLQNLIGGGNTNDAVIIEFDFVPLGDSVSFNYLFASEEYPEWVCSNFNDVFGFFISGPGINGPFSNNAANIALIPGTTTPVAINSVNPGVSGSNGLALNCDNIDPNWPNYNVYYNDNVANGGNAIEYDGFTTVLTAFRTGLQCGQVYHIKLAIADVFDGTFDSAVFLEQGSFTAPGIKVDVKTVTGDDLMIEGCAEASFVFIRPDTNGFDSITFDIAGNAVNGTDYTFLSNTVIFQPGEDSVTITISPIADGVSENTDTVIVTVMNITQCGDTIFETAELFIIDGYNLPISSSNVSTICPNDTITISAIASGGIAPYSYAWSTGQNGQAINVSPFATDTFFVTATDFPGCPGIDTVIVTVQNPNPNIFAGVDTGFCIGQSVQLLATGGVSYVWSPGTGLNNATIDAPIASGTGLITYIITGTDVNGCMNTDTILVTGDSLPFIAVRTDTSICLNDSIQLGGNPSGPITATFTWSPINSINNPTSGNPWASPITNPTEYIFTVTSLGNCSVQDTVTIGVLSLPVVTTSNDIQICIGDTVQISAIGGLNYVWTPSSSLSSSSIPNPLSFPIDTTNYIISVTDVNNCSSIDSVLITVNPLPAADAGQNTWICPGSNVQLIASGGQTYAWTPTVGLSDTSIFNPIASPLDTTLYYLFVLDSNSCANLDSVRVDVGANVPVQAGNDTGVCILDTIQLGGSPTAPPGSIFSWGPNIFMNDATFSNPLVNPNIDIQYTVSVTNDTCSGADTINLVIYSLPNVQAFGDTSICSGDSVILNAQGGVLYNWIPGASLSNPNNDTTFAKPGSNTLYQVEIFDTNNCSVIDSVQVNVFSLPMPVSTLDTTICRRDTISLISSGGQTYNWMPNGSLQNSNNDTVQAFPQDTTTYIVTVIDVNNCMQIDTIVVNVFPSTITNIIGDTSFCIYDTNLFIVNGAISYSWNPLGFIQVLNNDSVLVFPIANDTLFLQSTDSNTCVVSDTLPLLVSNLPIIQLMDSTELCLNDTIQIFVSGGQTYAWIPTSSAQMTGSDSVSLFPLDTGFIYLSVTDSNNCTNNDSIFVTVNPLPVFDLVSDTSTCANDSITITAIGVGAFNWEPTVALNSPNNATTSIAAPLDSIVYTVTLMDSNQCISLKRVTLFSFDIKISNDTAICDAERFQFKTTIIGGNDPLTFSWSPANQLNDATIAEPLVDIVENTQFQLITQDVTGCVDTAFTNLEVKINPIADFSSEVLPSCEGVLLKLNDESINAQELWWYLNGMDSSFAPNIERVFNYGDSVQIRLLVRNMEGCVDDTVSTIQLSSFEEYMDLDIANVFTPNFDGQNEWFELNLQNDLQGCSELRIYNRFGQLLFISTGNNHSWNGRSFDGQEAPEGVYFYILTVSEMDFKGPIHLLR